MTKIEKYSRALEALAAVNLIGDPDCKQPVKEFIRKASETSSGHATTHYRSREVASDIRKQIELGNIRGISQYQKYCSRKFRHEHMVPCEAIYLIVRDLKSAAEIQKIIEQFSIRATITHEENRRLDEGAGNLRSKMPEGFLIPGHKYHMNPLARYEEKGLHLDLERRPLNFDFWIERP